MIDLFLYDTHTHCIWLVVEAGECGEREDKEDEKERTRMDLFLLLLYITVLSVQNVKPNPLCSAAPNK